jgi:hypothetical protein
MSGDLILHMSCTENLPCELNKKKNLKSITGLATDARSQGANIFGNGDGFMQ